MKSKTGPILYYLSDGLEFCRWFESELIPKGAHCALAGSVLHKGQSTKDIDIIVYPHSERFVLSVDGLIDIVKGILPGAYNPVNPEYPEHRQRLILHNEHIHLDIFLFSDQGRAPKPTV